MLNTTGHLRVAVLKVAADLLGDYWDREWNPEYTRAVVEMASELIGYTGDTETAHADVIAAIVDIHNERGYGK